jgi:AbrB family looped-hinge helix DNA binding protein
MTKRGQFTITIPKNVTELLGLKKGDDMIIGLTAQNEIILSKRGVARHGHRKKS